MAPAAVVILALIIYTGFAIPITNMHPWFRWINYLDPVSYAFEALMINEVCVECPPYYESTSLIELVPWSKD
jgi:ABC-type multidrug transport system permease subunit